MLRSGGEKMRKSPFSKKGRGTGIVVRVDRLAVLPVELKVEACVQLFFRVLAQVDPSAFAFLQRGLQAVFAPVLLRDKTDAEIRDGICAAVYHGDLHGILLCTAGGKAQTEQRKGEHQNGVFVVSFHFPPSSAGLQMSQLSIQFAPQSTAGSYGSSGIQPAG